MTKQKVILRVENLSWGKILRGVNLYVNAGELVGIIGPNGSGKSSLLRCIYRVNKPTAGKILLYDSDVWQMKSKDVSKNLALQILGCGRNHFLVTFFKDVQ